MLQARRAAQAQHDRYQGADVRDVHDVRHDDGFRRNHYSSDHQDISLEPDGRGHVSVRQHGGDRRRGILSGSPGGYVRAGSAPSWLGLTLFAAASYLFAAGNSFVYFSILLAVSGIGIGVFKTGALALIGDLSKSTTEHTSLMNTVEGFFGVGSIIGPAILAHLLGDRRIVEGIVRSGRYSLRAADSHRVTRPIPDQSEGQRGTYRPQPYAGGNEESLRTGVFAGRVLYVATEAAVYVWMPTLLMVITAPQSHSPLTASPSSSSCALSGRFVGAWMLERFYWTKVLALFSGVDSDLLSRCSDWRRGDRCLSAARFRPVHVGDLPQHQFQGN